LNVHAYRKNSVWYIFKTGITEQVPKYTHRLFSENYKYIALAEAIPNILDYPVGEIVEKKKKKKRNVELRKIYSIQKIFKKCLGIGPG